MKSRLLSFVVIWGVIAAALVLGKVWAGLAILLFVTGAAHWEFFQILGGCGAGGVARRAPMGVALGVLTLALLAWGLLAPAGSGGGFLTGYTPGAERGLGIAVPGLLIGAVTLVLLFADREKLIAIFTRWPTALTFLLVPCSMAPLSELAAERWRGGLTLTGDASGLLLVLWLVAVVKFGDCGGLVVGCSLGRHKLAPSISPAKTWEGCAGALLFSAVTGGALAWLFGHCRAQLGFDPVLARHFTPLTGALLALPLSALGIASDLVESVFKRKAGVKDSGATIPGIGGAFDLLDSLLLTAPAGFVLLKIFVFKVSFL
ncbi:MAG: phosphatidate cytidylyltransferase [Puniceicoccales bacterium]|jgi:CDP-diglyceride synthetase|nr:phosphatidate cytidylyltransferase [Puniceicoccales bacterium]